MNSNVLTKIDIQTDLSCIRNSIFWHLGVNYEDTSKKREHRNQITQPNFAPVYLKSPQKTSCLQSLQTSGQVVHGSFSPPSNHNGTIMQVELYNQGKKRARNSTEAISRLHNLTKEQSERNSFRFLIFWTVTAAPHSEAVPVMNCTLGSCTHQNELCLVSESLPEREMGRKHQVVALRKICTFSIPER